MALINGLFAKSQRKTKRGNILSDDKADKKPTPEGQYAIDVARLYGLDEDADRWGPLVLVIVALGLYFGVKLLFIVGGGYCKSDSESAAYLNHQITNQYKPNNGVVE
jgi:hypothetical protein